MAYRGAHEPNILDSEVASAGRVIMTNLDLHNEYNSSGDSIHDLFDQIEEGFLVPLYQREYTWEEENINQLFDDLVSGVRELADQAGDNTTTFLGTTILTTLDDKKDTVEPGEDRAQPTAVKLVIDGQQRIGTISLLSIGITSLLNTLEATLPADATYGALKAHCKDLSEMLRHLYALRLGRDAHPPHKPKIIRAAEDRWTFAGDDNSYNSPVARYVATYIRTGDSQLAFQSLDPTGGARVLGNAKLIERWLLDVSSAHSPDSPLYEQYPMGATIADDKIQRAILGFVDSDVSEVIKKCETDKTTSDYAAAAMYNLFLFAHYLLRRCGVNRLQPRYEEWGFDMFQALNSTGTPLTAFETFVPDVMRSERQAGSDWGKTASKEHMDDIAELFEATTTNEQKNQRTNELLSTVALSHKGKKLGNKFSAQRKWLEDVYVRELAAIDEKREFLGKVAQVANFFYSAWYMEEYPKAAVIESIKDHPEVELASLLVQYLRSARSALSAPVIARFYGSQLSDDQAQEFVEATKACAAFYTLWRSANSTAGLDDIYRRFFSGSEMPVKVASHGWGSNGSSVSSESLKKYFWEVLETNGIGTKESWITQSNPFLRFSEHKTLCRFVLFVAGHNRVPDPQNAGLTRIGTPGVCSLLTLERWMAKDHKTLEHIAPQSPPLQHTWDSNIYTENRFQEIGNLLLLPTDINELVDDKNWEVKFLHYAHVGTRTKEEVDELDQRAKGKGIVLSKRAIKALAEAQYSCAVEPILELGEDGPWDYDMISRRTTQIKEIVWDTLAPWLRGN